MFEINVSDSPEIGRCTFSGCKFKGIIRTTENYKMSLIVQFIDLDSIKNRKRSITTDRNISTTDKFYFRFCPCSIDFLVVIKSGNTRKRKITCHSQSNIFSDSHRSILSISATFYGNRSEIMVFGCTMNNDIVFNGHII